MHRLLGVTAHPDDEAGSFGGSLLLYAERGVETYLTCLTPGQAATHRGGANSDAQLAEMRRQELAAAAKVLKIGHCEVLDYPDGGLDRVDFLAAVGDLTARVRRIQPHVVITMGTEGSITAHPDHSMVAVLTTMAFHWAARNNRFPEQLQNGLTPHRVQKLYYTTALFTLPDRPPVSLSPVTTIIEIGARLLEEKIRAFKQHTSQSPLFAIFEKAVRQRFTKETFHLAASATPRHAEPETDLFAGVLE